MLTKDEFTQTILDKSYEYYYVDNPYSRWGQAVFNSTVELFDSKIARTSQFVYRVDCYYHDDKVEDFLDKCYELYVIDQKKPIDYQKVLNWWNTSHGENRENSRLELIKTIECE